MGKTRNHSAGMITTACLLVSDVIIWFHTADVLNVIKIINFMVAAVDTSV